MAKLIEIERNWKELNMTHSKNKSRMLELPEKQFYTVDEVAELLSVHRQTVLMWIGTGVLIACKLGTKAYRINRGDLQAYIEETRG